MRGMRQDYLETRANKYWLLFESVIRSLRTHRFSSCSSISVYTPRKPARVAQTRRLDIARTSPFVVILDKDDAKPTKNSISFSLLLSLFLSGHVSSPCIASGTKYLTLSVILIPQFYRTFLWIRFNPLAYSFVNNFNLFITTWYSILYSMYRDISRILFIDFADTELAHSDDWRISFFLYSLQTYEETIGRTASGRGFSLRKTFARQSTRLGNSAQIFLLHKYLRCRYWFS